MHSGSLEEIKKHADPAAVQALKVKFGNYNVPFETAVPASSFAVSPAIEVGIRVVPSGSVRTRLDQEEECYSPSYEDIKNIHTEGGWRFEDFVADHFIRCIEGDRFNSLFDNRVFNFINRRSEPIAAAIYINIWKAD